MTECVVCFETKENQHKCKKCNNLCCCSQCYKMMKVKKCPLCRELMYKNVQYGDFSFMENFDTKMAIEATFEAINNINGWNNVKYMKDEILHETEMMGVGHSGASWVISISHCEKIDEIGWDNYVNWMLFREP